MLINRRTCLAGGASILTGAASILAAGIVPTAAQAQPPTFHRTKHGAFEIISLFDGYMDVAAAGAASNTTEAEVDATLAAAGLPKSRILQPVNVTFVRTATDLIAIDLGAGPNFLDGLGKLGDSMSAAGLDPKSVTKVLFTHGHPDHLWGAIDEFDDSIRFPNAQYLMAAVELDLWLAPDAETKLPSDRANFVPGARRNLKGLKDRLTTFKPGQDLVSGIRAIETAGHTQGHVSFEIAGPDPLVVLGDALIHPIISFAYPDWRPAADHEPDRAATMRKALLDRLATDKARILGYHLTRPGLGRVERKDTKYRFVAEGT
jgi:glyoxylase-like metal-dependent hydrolase (beta-lactamase superfamily II)